jgi:hypothetical protein
MRCPRPLTLTSVVAVAAVSLLTAGCGSNSPSSSSSGGQPAQAQLQQGQQDAVRFVQCLRSHGVTNVPDPTSASGHAFKDAVSGDAQSPAFRSAYTACTHLLPNGGPRRQSAAQRQSQPRVPELPRPDQQRPADPRDARPGRDRPASAGDRAGRRRVRQRHPRGHHQGHCGPLRRGAIDRRSETPYAAWSS